MSRMSYRWSQADWEQYYSSRVGNVSFLILLNIIALVATFCLSGSSPQGLDERFMLPALAMAIDFGIMYAMMDDIGDGFFAGIACGIIFGVFMLGMAIGADAHISALIPPAAAVVTAILFYGIAVINYLGKLSALRNGLPVRRSR